jgi:hypothetical protein
MTYTEQETTVSGGDVTRVSISVARGGGGVHVLGDGSCRIVYVIHTFLARKE